MSELSQAISGTYQAMYSIDSVVRQAVAIADHLHEDRTSLGFRVGLALAEWNQQLPIEQRHDPRWIAKKATDSLLTLLTSPVLNAMNRAMNLPEDYRP